MSTVKKFKVGQMWSNDFDYEGMMKYGLKVKPTTKLATLKKLYDSLEDVNYHSCNQPLGNAIYKLENNNPFIEADILEFNNRCQAEIDGWEI